MKEHPSFILIDDQIHSSLFEEEDIEDTKGFFNGKGMLLEILAPQEKGFHWIGVPVIMDAWQYNKYI